MSKTQITHLNTPLSTLPNTLHTGIPSDLHIHHINIPTNPPTPNHYPALIHTTHTHPPLLVFTDNCGPANTSPTTVDPHTEIFTIQMWTVLTVNRLWTWYSTYHRGPYSYAKIKRLNSTLCQCPTTMDVHSWQCLFFYYTSVDSKSTIVGEYKCRPHTHTQKDTLKTTHTHTHTKGYPENKWSFKNSFGPIYLIVPCNLLRHLAGLNEF